jgi:hypothetical protein
MHVRLPQHACIVPNGTCFLDRPRDGAAEAAPV